MAKITITIEDVHTHAGTVRVFISEPPPVPGRALTPAQAVSMDLLLLCKGSAVSVTYGHSVPDQATLEGSAE